MPLDAQMPCPFRYAVICSIRVILIEASVRQPALASEAVQETLTLLQSAYSNGHNDIAQVTKCLFCYILRTRDTEIKRLPCSQIRLICDNKVTFHNVNVYLAMPRNFS